MVLGMWCSFELNATAKQATAKSLGERYELPRGPSRSKDALRMTAKTNNGEVQEQAKAKYGDSGFARMTTSMMLRQNDD
jgi:hypothetical protein